MHLLTICLKYDRAEYTYPMLHGRIQPRESGTNVLKVKFFYMIYIFVR